MESSRFDSLTRGLANGRSRRSLLFGLIGSGGALVAGRAALAKPAGKVTLCHMPGTPARMTITVSANALNGHLRHGDHLGECQPCVDGTMQCSGTGFDTCAEGVWFYRECGEGTICVPNDGAGINCSSPDDPLR